MAQIAQASGILDTASGNRCDSIAVKIVRDVGRVFARPIGLGYVGPVKHQPQNNTQESRGCEQAEAPEQTPVAAAHNSRSVRSIALGRPWALSCTSRAHSLTWQ